MTQTNVISDNSDMLLQHHIFERALHAMGAIIHVIELSQFRIVYSNGELLRILGYASDTSAQNMDELVASLTHPEDTETLRLLLEDAARLGDGASVDGEFRIKGANSEWRWLRTFITPFTRNGQGQVTHALTIGYDITPKRQIRDDLRDSKYLLQAVLDAVPVRLFWKDLNSTYLGCNRRFAQDVGVDSPDKVRGLTDLALFGEQAETFREKDQQVIQSGKAVLNYEEEQTNPDGEHLWVRRSKVPLYSSAGEMFGVMGTYEDLTEQKLAEAEREALQRQLIDAQKQALLELSTPIIPVLDQLIVMPLIGAIDTDRAREITRALLQGVSTYRAQVVILDITGVPIVDSAVAEYLNRTIQAARLKGAYTIITGISDAVAETIVELGIDWNHTETLRDLQSGLTAALKRLGIRLERIRSTSPLKL